MDNLRCHLFISTFPHFSIIKDVAELICSSTVSLGLLGSLLERTNDTGVGVTEARARVDTSKSFADELYVDRRLVRSERGGVRRVEEGEVEESGITGIDVGDELTALLEKRTRERLD